MNIKIYVIRIICLIFFTVNISAQTIEEIVTGLDTPFGVAFLGDELFIAEFGANRILKIDVTETNPSPIELALVVNGPTDMAFKDNELYICRNNGFISKIDVTQSPPVLIDFINTQDPGNPFPSFPGGIVFNGNDLYFSDEDNIYKIDITETPPTMTHVRSLSAWTRLAVLDNMLYYSNGFDKIFKLDMTNPNLPSILVVDNITPNVYVGSMVILGDILYFSQYDRISKKEIGATSTTYTEITQNSINPLFLATHNDDLYFSSNPDKILKISSSNLSINENDINSRISLYPNPAQDLLNIATQEQINLIRIYSIQGNVVKETAYDSEIDISGLASGMYFIQLISEGKTITKKFIKE